jgi:radical SAM protein with 4Fe4S-binding SPASM domain
LFSVFPAGRAAHDNLLTLSDNQFKGLMEFIAQTRKEGLIKASYGCEGFLGGYEAEVRDSFYFCQAGISAASVLADGSISGCPSIRSNFYQGNIYKDSLADVWENRFEKYRDRSWAKKGICENCKQFRYCLGNGMHLRDEKDNLMFCHYQKISSTH